MTFLEKVLDSCCQKSILLESSLLSFHLFFCSCLGMLLQKVDDRAYVRDKIDWMYKQANIAIPTNRLGLAKAMGLVTQSSIFINAVFSFSMLIICPLNRYQVAASHLDTVLDKLKAILDNVGQSIFQRCVPFNDNDVLTPTASLKCFRKCFPIHYALVFLVSERSLPSFVLSFCFRLNLDVQTVYNSYLMHFLPLFVLAIRCYTMVFF